jgi:toxin ParE1/3/4
MRFAVLLTEHAARDLEDIYAHIAERDGPSRADRAVDRIEEMLASLATFPERGAHPRELRALGFHEYRQLLFKPYRLIYRVIADRVYVHLIADGRRDMQALLARRLLGA